MAILGLMIDTGLRRGEVAAMKVSDVDLDNRTVSVIGKGNRPATVFFGVQAAADIDRYLRARGRHPHAAMPAMWLAIKARLRAMASCRCSIGERRGRGSRGTCIPTCCATPGVRPGP